MNKIIRTIIASLLFITGILIVMPFMANKSGIQQQIEQSISQKLGAKFEAKDGIGIRLFPTPQISLRNATTKKIKINDENSVTIIVPNLIIKPAIFSLIRGKVVIKSLVFENAKIENQYTESTTEIDVKQKREIVKELDTEGSFFGKIFNFQKSDQEVFDLKNTKHIQFINSTFSRSINNGQITAEFSQINFFLQNQVSKNTFTAEGDFMAGEIPTSFNLIVNAETNKNSTLTIQSPIVNFILSGKFTNSNINNLIQSNFSGKIDAEIVDLKMLLNRYFSKSNLLYLKINATQPIKINSDINNRGGVISLENILIKSKLIDGTGKIYANFNNSKPKIDANFNLENIDIENIWISGFINTSNDIIKSENDIIQKFINKDQSSSIANNDEDKSRIIDLPTINSVNKSMLDNLTLSASIKVKNAKYYGGNLQDLDLDFLTSADGNILFRSMSAKIAGGILRASGTLEEENNIPKFTGTIEISGSDLSKSLSWLKIDLFNLKPQTLNDYNFSANILALPNFNIFNNINLSINNSKNIVVGNFLIDDSAAISASSANLRINSLNYDDYFLSDKQGYLSSGSLLKKILWLNTVISNRNINLIFDQLSYGDNNFTNQSLKVEFGQGYIKLPDLDFHSENFNLRGKIEVDIKSKIPQFNLKIVSDNIAYNSQNGDLLDQLFKLPSLGEFSGKISIEIGKLAVKSWGAENLIADGELKDGIINFDSLNFKTYDGDFKYKGSVVMKIQKTINGTLEMFGINNGKFLSDVFNINNISGISNISASLNSVAESKDDFFKNLNAQVIFISGGVVVKGFGIYDLATKIVQPKKYSAELSSPLDILYNPQSQSSLKEVTGAMVFKKDSDDQFNIKTSSVGINGVVHGSINDKKIIDGAANFIFISGKREKPVPISFAVNFKGKLGQVEQSTNLDQVKQYLDRGQIIEGSPQKIDAPQPIKDQNIY